MSNKVVNANAKVLLKAKELINNPKNWAKFKGWDHETQAFCALGAIADAYWQINGHLANIDWVVNLFQNTNRIDCIPKWNDAPGTSHTMVLQAFDKAIERAITSKA